MYGLVLFEIMDLTSFAVLTAVLDVPVMTMTDFQTRLGIFLNFGDMLDPKIVR